MCLFSDNFCKCSRVITVIIITMGITVGMPVMMTFIGTPTITIIKMHQMPLMVSITSAVSPRFPLDNPSLARSLSLVSAPDASAPPSGGIRA